MQNVQKGAQLALRPQIALLALSQLIIFKVKFAPLIALIKVLIGTQQIVFHALILIVLLVMKLINVGLVDLHILFQGILALLNAQQGHFIM